MKVTALKNMPQYMKKGLTLSGKDIIIVKYDKYNKFFKKDEAVVIIYYINGNYKE